MRRGVAWRGARHGTAKYQVGVECGEERFGDGFVINGLHSADELGFGLRARLQFAH